MLITLLFGFSLVFSLLQTESAKAVSFEARIDSVVHNPVVSDSIQVSLPLPSDSIAVDLPEIPDSVLPDTLQSPDNLSERLSEIDTLTTESPDLEPFRQRARRDSVSVLPLPRTMQAARPFFRPHPPILQIRLADDKVEVKRDTTGDYRIQRLIGTRQIGHATIYTFEQYAREHRKHIKRENFVRFIREEERRRDTRRGVLDFRITIPGGQRSAFTTIFGRPEVNLRVTGSANMNIGVSITETQDPSLPADQRKRVDPKFDQNLKLNIQGTIGDKLTISTDWDTERDFDFENRLNILYTGYEDEIIQSIELGNVSMETGNSLIRGGGALFGIKARAKLGALEVTTVLSQQEGNSEVQTISGGSQEQRIDIAPNAYEDDRHFFLDFYTLQEFETLMSDPFYSGRILELINIDVYLLNISSAPIEGQRRAIALLDYGTVEFNGQFLPPNDEQDGFDINFLEQFRDPTVGVSASDLGVASDEFEEGEFFQLERGRHYTVNESLGFISLDARIDQRQAVAVAYSYRNQSGEVVYVGEPNQGDNQRLFLKLLRPSTQSTNSRSWPLTMRNIYSLNTRNLTRDALELDIFFTGGNTDQINIPGLNNILLQSLGLDRVDQQGNAQPDNQIDFNTPTLDPTAGRIIFPYLQPFGQRIIDVINQSNLPEAEREEAINRYAFPELYTSRQSNAGQNSKNSIYRIKGSARGGVSDTYFLGAIGLVPGSVRVTANGVELSEGVDYEIDYVIGNIVITNRRYLASGQEIRIEYESNQFLQIQQTTFTGVRAQYNVNDNIRFGGTFFNLKERPIQDKIPIGDEPINNTIIGFDARARFDAPWLTRALDALPILQTRAASTIDISGEWAQLRPGISQTNAVQRAIDRGDLFPDEENGLAFIDDFEGSKSTISFLNPGRWNIAAAPYALPDFDTDLTNASQSTTIRATRSDRRAQFSWYMIPINEDRSGQQFPESAIIPITQVFPNRQIRASDQNILQTLDVFFNPRERGPYNYNMNLREYLEDRPHDMWGGMTAVLPGGLGDFTQQNIEFLEFWVQPILPDGRAPSSVDIERYNGTIFFDIGTVSEDVIPNNTLNTEDGLYERENNLRVDAEGRSYVLNTPVEFDGQFSVVNIEREDVGLDGIPSTGNGGLNEQTLFADFIAAMEIAYADDPQRVEQIRNDPSNDEYVFYRNNLVRPLPLHQRFYRMYGYLEGNAISSGSQQAVSSRPDSEGLINAATVNTINAFYQYELRLNPADTTGLRIGSNYIVDIQRENPAYPWYQIRIPIRDFVRQVGNIEDLQRVTHIRMWMHGYEEPFTLRFATLEFVGNLWRKSENVGNTEDQTTTFDISTINIEENASRQPVPYRVPPGAIRSRIRGQQDTVADNEQSIVLSVQNLKPGDVRMISRIYPGNLSLVNYSNMRMFVHGEGYANREDVEVVVRLGTNLETNYYEFRQPITPTDTTYTFGPNLETYERFREDVDMIWKPDQNSVNIVLSVLNELKQLRNLDGIDPDIIYERSDILRDAAPGATVAIRGNPSLDRITEIGLGIRNPAIIHEDDDAGKRVVAGRNNRNVPKNGQSINAELWLNELRVSGFDNNRAWSGNVNARIQMADFASLNARFSHTQDGFGSINSRMVDRRKSDESNYDLNTTVNLHRFIPDRYGWNIPISLGTRSSVSTPRFLPREGDIRYSEFVNAIRNDVADPAEQDRIINERLREIQTRSQSYSLNLTGITKNNSRTALMRYMLDPLTLSYNYTTSSSSNPNNAFDDRWNYSTGLNYNLTFRNVQTVRPLGFMENLPVLNLISGLRFAYLPSSIGTTHTLDRRYSETQRRSFGTQEPFALQQTHQFGYVNTFNINYDIMPPVSLRMNTRSEYNLDPISRVMSADSLTYEIRSSFDILQDAFFNSDVEMRREQYSENYTASWRPRFNQIQSLRWLSYQANYRGGFTWRNSPIDRNLGATVANQYNLDNTLGIRVQDLMRRVPFYDNIVKANEQEVRQREQRSRAKQQQRDRERDERRRERERQRALERGETPPADNARNRPQPQRTGAAVAEAPSLAENAKFYVRQLLLAGFSMQTLDITYGFSRNTSQSGYAGGATIFNMFNDPEETSNFSPEFGYRIGLNNRIPFSQIVRPETEQEVITLSKQENLRNDLRFRTRLSPMRDISIDLDWNLRWSENRQNSFNVFFDSLATQFTQGGEIETSVWAFGRGYNSFFRSQLQTAFDGLPETGQTISATDDGRMVLGPNTIQNQFRSAYLVGVGSTVDSRSYMPFPMPTWRVNWGGWERRIGFMRRYISRMSLSHNYTSNYRLQWRYFPDEGAEVTRRIGDFTALDNRSEFEPNSITLTRSFQPFVGVNATFHNGLRLTMNYNRSKTTSFSLSNSNVVESESQSITMQLGYSKRGFRLPFFKRFQNTIDLNLNINYAEDIRLTYLLNNDLGEVLRGAPGTIDRDVNQYSPGEPSERGDARITITPSIGYTFSQTIRANFEYRYFQLMPRSSNVFARTDQDIVFNIVITIRS